MSRIVKKIVKQYAAELKHRNYPFSALYLFGSHAKNKANKWSDIDVGVISNKLKRNWWKNEQLLSKISLDIDLRIEPHGFTPEEFNDPCNPMAHEIKKTGIRVV